MATTDRNDCAVAFCCDRNYFHLALFLIWQLAHHNPFRKFDLVISTQDDLEVPNWAKPLGVFVHKAGAVPNMPGLPTFHGSMAPLLRNMLARELGDRYRRILYMDCDIHVDGGDVNRLLEVDLGSHPIGAVLDAPFFFEANYRAKEYQKAGLPAKPYANTGVQVIDTRAYREQDVERRSFAMLEKYPQAIVLTDQSLTNLALRGGFAQLAPCWNWQLNGRYPLVPMRYPVFFRHFVSRKKPDRDSSGWFDVRFNQAYRDFFTTFMPEALAKLAVPGDPAPMRMADASRIVMRHFLGMDLVEKILARHPDPYTAII